MTCPSCFSSTGIEPGYIRGTFVFDCYRCMTRHGIVEMLRHLDPSGPRVPRKVKRPG